MRPLRLPLTIAWRSRWKPAKSRSQGRDRLYFQFLKEAIGIFVGSTLPGTLWIAKEYLYICGYSEPAMRRHFLSSVPRQRFVLLMRQPPSMPDQRIDDRFGVLRRHLDQHEVACLPFDQRGDLTITTSKKQVAFPVAWYGSILR